MTIQVDQLRLSYKNPCRIATTAAIVLATTGLTAIDGVTPVTGDRVLVKDQSAGAENGIYIAATTAWVRALDFNISSEDSLQAGLTTRIQEGTANAGLSYKLDTTGLITLDTTALVFTRSISNSLVTLETLGDPSADGEFIVATGAGVFAYESGDTARTSLGLGTGDAPTFAEFHIVHTATEADDHAIEIDANAAGFGDVKALDINYITGATELGSDEAVILVNIDESSATGGDVVALEVLATEGSANIFGLFAGALVNPIQQLSGVFANADSFLVIAVDQLTAVSSGGAGNIAIFDNDDDTITIGSAAKFEELEFLLDTGASAAGIAPVFDFSTGTGTWATFTPTDGTNAFRNTGVVAWLDADIPSWATGTGTEYLIRITRTRNTLTTTPIVDKVQIAATVEYSWDKDGQLTVANMTITNTGASIALSLGTDGRIEFGEIDTRIAGNISAGRLDLHSLNAHRLYVGASASSPSVVINNSELEIRTVANAARLSIQESGTPPATPVGYGDYWVQNDAPTTPWFTDDASVDWELARHADSVSFTDATLTVGSLTVPTGAGIFWDANTRIEGTTGATGDITIYADDDIVMEADDRFSLRIGGALEVFTEVNNRGVWYLSDRSGPPGAFAGFGGFWNEASTSRPWFTDDTSVDWEFALNGSSVSFTNVQSLTVNTPSGGHGLIENLLTFSEDLTNAIWVHNGGWGDSTANHLASPTGETTTTRTRILAADATGNKLLRHNITLTNSATYTLSFWAKRGSVSAATLQLNGDLGDGTAFGSQTLTTAWEYFSFVMTADTGDFLDLNLIGHDSVTDSEFFIWGVTIQNGDVDEPYVRTKNPVAATYGSVTNGLLNIQGSGLRLQEQTTGPGFTADTGQIWVENEDPNTLMYTDSSDDEFHVSGQIKIVADPGDAAAIPVTGSARIYMTTGTEGETNTLADPTEDGHILILSLDTDGGGNRVITADSIINDNGNTIMTFDEIGETLMLRSTMIRLNGSDSYLWMIIGGISGVGLS